MDRYDGSGGFDKMDKTMEIIYRLASLDDLNEICALVSGAIDAMVKRHIFQWDDLYPTREDFLTDIDKKQLYVGMAEERIAVIFVVNQEYDEEYENGDWKYRDAPFCVLHRLCVNPVFQNQKVAGRTLLHIEKEMKKRGMKAIRLDAFSENPFALKLYDRHGYTKVGHADWRMGRFYLMEKFIS